MFLKKSRGPYLDPPHVALFRVWYGLLVKTFIGTPRQSITLEDLGKSS